jgi:hypothetical protein
VENSIGSVIPSEDIMILRLATIHEKAWIPACAGMTDAVTPAKAGVHWQRSRLFSWKVVSQRIVKSSLGMTVKGSE